MNTIAGLEQKVADATHPLSLSDEAQLAVALLCMHNCNFVPVSPLRHIKTGEIYMNALTRKDQK